MKWYGYIFISALILILIGCGINLLGNDPKEEKEVVNFSASLSPERASPRIRINESMFHQYGKEFEISFWKFDRKVRWFTALSDTNSEDPLIDVGVKIIVFVPEIPEDVAVGDLVVYNKSGSSLLHRVVDFKEGSYYIMPDNKPDGNMEIFGDYVNFSAISYVVLGLLY